MRSPGPVFIGPKGAAVKNRHAKQPEETLTDTSQRNLFRIRPSGEIHKIHPMRGNVLEQRSLLTP